MSLELLDKTRKIYRLLNRQESEKVDFNNKKAILYGLVVIADEDGNYGVVDLKKGYTGDTADTGYQLWRLSAEGYP